MNNRSPFDDFHKNTRKGAAGIAGVGCLMVIINAILTIAVLAGCVWVVLLLLQHFGVI